MKSGRSRHGCLHCYQRHQGQGEAKEESGHGFRGVVGGGWMQVVLPLLAARHGAPSPFLLLFPLTLSLGCPGRRTPVYHEKGQRDVSITDVVRPRRYCSQEMHPLERRKKMMVTSDAATPPPSFNFLLVAWSLFAVVGHAICCTTQTTTQGIGKTNTRQTQVCTLDIRACVPEAAKKLLVSARSLTFLSTSRRD